MGTKGDSVDKATHEEGDVGPAVTPSASAPRGAPAEGAGAAAGPAAR
ncbi:hypothetical protein GCM10010507_06920 [Streptomyces cinnamoneus]|uniref:Uncharacterized protein n=1 Tax=Streptomyces cinnamoneus TaxID=53446 RepID=A0A918TB39_STRCJ|nr:hypothetical protein GCM10010507_06920 [Streptomyces cinnamoneus]